MNRRSKVSDRVEKENKTGKLVQAYLTQGENNDVNNDVNSDVNSDIVDDVDSSTNIDSDDDIIDSVSGDTNNDNPTVVNGVVIEAVSKKLQPKRATYYLKPDTIKEINKISKNSGLGKSEIVQMLLEHGLKNITIKTKNK